MTISPQTVFVTMSTRSVLPWKQQELNMSGYSRSGLICLGTRKFEGQSRAGPQLKPGYWRAWHSVSSCLSVLLQLAFFHLCLPLLSLAPLAASFLLLWSLSPICLDESLFLLAFGSQTEDLLIWAIIMRYLLIFFLHIHHLQLPCWWHPIWPKQKI
jgi:hypothetical protein